MEKRYAISTTEQYDSLGTEEYLQIIHAGILVQNQRMEQVLATVVAILELQSMHETPLVKDRLQDMNFDPEPIPAIQRRIEAVRQEFDEDLRSGLYDSGL